MSSLRQMIKKDRARESGQTCSCEFAISAARFLLLLIFATLDFGFLFFAKVTMQNAVRQAGRYADYRQLRLRWELLREPAEIACRSLSRQSQIILSFSIRRSPWPVFPGPVPVIPEVAGVTPEARTTL